jgi:hypothetical protein
MPIYTVMIDDNFHSMEPGERWDYGAYSTQEEAVAICRHLVDCSLLEQYKPGMSATELYELYASFGDDPFIVTIGGSGETAPFSARDYARERADMLAAEGRLPGFDPPAMSPRDTGKIGD